VAQAAITRVQITASRLQLDSGTSLDLDVSGSLECAGRLVNQSPEASVSSLVIPAMLLAIARGTGTLVLDFLLCISAD
jgi:hypothetical protein